MADPNNPPPPPQLHQILGSVLRDVAQARFMSDLYSRQISFKYEEDSLLRTFPVPRVEIEEVEFDLQFGILAVTVDEKRHESEHAAISSLLDQYSVSITREGLAPLRTSLYERINRKPNPDANKAKAEAKAAEQFERTFLSDENRDRLRGRLLRFFNEEIESWFGKVVDAETRKETRFLKEDEARAAIEARLNDFRDSLRHDKDLQAVCNAVPLEDNGWDKALDKAKSKVTDEVQSMLNDIKGVLGRYPDYKVEIDVTPDGLRNHPAVSHVRVKSAVKNYRWSKVDVDPTDMRNVRNLTME